MAFVARYQDKRTFEGHVFDLVEETIKDMYRRAREMKKKSTSSEKKKKK